MAQMEAWKEQNVKSRLSKISRRGWKNMAIWKPGKNPVQGPRNPTDYFQKWGSAQWRPKTDFMSIRFENWESLVTFMTKRKKKVNFSVKSSQKTLYHSGGYTPSLDFIIYHYVLKAMAPHSSTLAWKIPWMEEPGGLLSMGSHRVGHDWSNLAAAAAAFFYNSLTLYWDYLFTCSFPHQTESRESQGQIFLPPIICIKT